MANTSKKQGKKKTAAAPSSPADPHTNPYTIVQYPLSTEKSVRQIEFENKISFAVAEKATKPQIKKAVEELYKVKVLKVNTLNSFSGIKKAIVKLSPAHSAADLSADLGMI